MIPKVAILGRPNVGKSTLFNRLLGKRKVLVSSQSGMTRDRQYAKVEWGDRSFILIDTGGFQTKSYQRIHKLVNQQVKQAIEESNLLIFVVDGKEGLNTLDREIAQLIRKSSKRVIVIVNKIDNPKREGGLYEFFQLGFKDILPLSALHGLNSNKVLDDICNLLPKSISSEIEDVEPLKVALVGKPNVGKSSLLNTLIGKDQVIVDEIPGTTQDSVDILVSAPPVLGEKSEILLIDTGGFKRKKKKMKVGEIEMLTNLSSRKSIERSNIAILLLEPPCHITRNEKSIARYIYENLKGCIIAVNKMDLTTWGKSIERSFLRKIREEMPFLSFAPVLFISAKTGKEVNRIFHEIRNVFHFYDLRVDNTGLEKIVLSAYRKRYPPHYRGRQVRIKSAKQLHTSPPVVSIEINKGGRIPDSYKRYLINEIRNVFGFWGSPIKLVCR